MTAAPDVHSQRDYARWRNRQIAYGRWRPWASAAPVREHIRLLRTTGATIQDIANAAGVSPLTIYRLQRKDRMTDEPARDRIRTPQAERLLAVTPEVLKDNVTRRDSTGTRRRLQALVAMGHPANTLARQLGVECRVTWDIIRGRTATVTPALHTAVCELYDRLWDLRPPERTAAERRAATMARRRAVKHGWSTPMGLDDDHIDDPNYRPRTIWRPAIGVDVTAIDAHGYPSKLNSDPH